jgi:hypothetical protein
VQQLRSLLNLTTDVVQVCRRTISGFCGRRTEIGDSQTLDFAGLRIFDENGIEAKSLADDQGSIAAPHLAPSVSDRLVVKRLTSASKCALPIFSSALDTNSLGGREHDRDKCRRCGLTVQGGSVSGTSAARWSSQPQKAAG